MASSFVNGPRPAMSSESITVSTTSIGPTTTKIRIYTAAVDNRNYGDVTQAVEAFLSVEDQALRYWIDGTTPTASVGHQLNAGDTRTIQGYQNISNLKMIRKDGSDAIVRLTYFK